MKGSYLIAAFIAAIALFASPRAVQAQGTYFTPQSVLKDFFAASTRVTFIEIDAASIAAQFKERLGYAPAKKKYTVFIATTGEHLDGYAVLDDEIGQHQPISIATQISPDLKVKRTEVMAYREAYGSEIRENRYRQQFVGKNATQPLRLGDDIVAISGATISSRSMAIAVKRALFLVSIYKETH